MGQHPTSDRVNYYHGTDRASALRLLAGEPLDASESAKRKMERLAPDGFFLATDPVDAEFFAIRRVLGTILTVAITADAYKRLQASGMIQRKIPSGPKSVRFSGDELIVPPEAFPTFDCLRASGEILVSP